METTAPKAIVIGGGIGGRWPQRWRCERSEWPQRCSNAPPKSARSAPVCPCGLMRSPPCGGWDSSHKSQNSGRPWYGCRSSASGQVLSQITIQELSRKAGAPSLCVHRADLLRTFAEALKLSVIRTNATCVGFEQHSDVVTARLADGQSESGDLLLGADGIQSAIRAQLFHSKGPLIPTGRFVKFRKTLEFFGIEMTCSTLRVCARHSRACRGPRFAACRLGRHSGACAHLLRGGHLIASCARRGAEAFFQSTSRLPRPP